MPLIDQDFVCFICGEGKTEKRLLRLTRKLNLTNRVFFLGYRTDVLELLTISNIYVSTSKREGLSRTVSESMAAGLPCIVSNRRGLKDLVIDKNGGFLIEPNDFKRLAFYVNFLNKNIEKYNKMSSFNINRIKSFSTEVVKNEMKAIYEVADGIVDQKRNTH